MSFKIDTNNPTILIAEEEIICFKPLIPTDEQGRYYSNIRMFPYELKWHYKETDFGKKKAGFIVYPGLFSFRTLEAGKKALGVWGDECVWVECFIPEDTEYYYNAVEDSYLSSELALWEEIPTDHKPEVMKCSEKDFAAVGAWEEYGVPKKEEV